MKDIGTFDVFMFVAYFVVVILIVFTWSEKEPKVFEAGVF